VGASAWHYVVPHRDDLVEALDALQGKLLARHDYHFEPVGRPWPATTDELWGHEDVHESGTHSALDLHDVIPADGADDFGTLRPLTEDERIRFFGTATPTRADFDGAGDALSGFGQRWSGYSTVLYDADGNPESMAIWGRSGD
jgi:hypothetical protein